MRITVTTLSDKIFNFEVNPDLDLASLKNLCAIESDIPANQISLLLNGRPLTDDKKKLKDYHIANGEVLLMQRIQGERGVDQLRNIVPSVSAPFIDFGSIPIPGGSGFSMQNGPQPSNQAPNLNDPATIRDILLNSPHDLALLRERNPPLSEALLSGSLAKFSQVLQQQQQERRQREEEKMRLMYSDPFDSDAQRKIAEEIRLKNVEHNMETAMEYAPESFGQVSMLYIDCTVNNHPVKAFVDSGAQMTIMSQECAERCNIMRLVDTRWAGVAKGVGVQAIIGRVHLCQVRIGDVFLQCSFSILKDQPMDMLLGLDMLKRHQCIIDLMNNELVIGSSETRTKFLAEADMPASARLDRSLLSLDDDDPMLQEALARSQEEDSKSKKRQQTTTTTHKTTTKSAATKANTSSPSPPPRHHQQQQHTTMTSSPPSEFPESSVSALMSHGFSRRDAIEQLMMSRGNVDEALAALIAKSFMD